MDFVVKTVAYILPRAGVFSESFSEEHLPPRANICQASAREDLQAIASVLAPDSLGREALNICFLVKTVTNLLPREVDFSFLKSIRPLRAKVCLINAREDLQGITSAPTPGSLSSETLIIGVIVKTAAREVDITKSVFQRVSILLEPRSA